MALSAADFQKAFTVDVPIGDIVSKGVQDIREDEAERERKRLQNVEYFYKQYDPLLIGTGTPDDPYINKLLQDAEQKVMSLPLKKMSQSQFVSSVRNELATIKARREQAKLFSKNIDNEVNALHELDPTIKKDALTREAKRKAFFNDDNTPVQEFDFNRNHAQNTFDSNPLQYVDIDAAGGFYNKETKNKIIQQSNVPSQYDPNTKFDITRNIYQRPKLNKDGSVELETTYQPIVVSKDLTLKALPEEQFNAMVNSPGGKWLIQSEYKRYKADPRLKDVGDEVLLHAAAYDVANNKTDRSETQIASKNEPKVGRGDGSGGGGGPKAVAQDITPVNNAIGAALGDSFSLSKLFKADGKLGEQGFYNANTLFNDGKFIIGYKKTKEPDFNSGGKLVEKEKPVNGQLLINPQTNEAVIYRELIDGKGNSQMVKSKSYPLKTAEQQNKFYNEVGLYNGTTALEGFYTRDIHQSYSNPQTILNNALSQKQLERQISQLGENLQGIIAPQKRMNFDFNLFANKPSNAF
jgi:hypothetical protein